MAMDRSRLIGYAQIGLSALFLTGYFAVLAAFLLGHIRTPIEWKDAMMTILGVLTGAVGVILSFWFSRSRKESESG